MLNRNISYSKNLKSIPITSDRVVSLNLVKSFLRIANSEEDELLTNLISMATEYAEWYMEKSLLQKEYSLYYTGVIPKTLYLIFGPIIKINNVSFEYSKLTTKIYDYHLNLFTNTLEFRNTLGTGDLLIKYIAGYEDTNLIPEQIKEGILLHISSSYHQRSSISMIQKIYQPFRQYNIAI